MALIKNFDNLNKTPNRKICLDLVETALSSIQPQNIIDKNFSLNGDILKIQDKSINLKEYDRVLLLGIGKGSAGLSQKLEKMFGDMLKEGYVIDLEPEDFSKIEFTQGTHPLPSESNLSFTKKVLDKFNNLTSKDLVLVVIAGGGSALFEKPNKVSLEKLIDIFKHLLTSGADITEMNIVRKHLSLVKGGGLAKLFYPATIVSVLASDVPGNDPSVIASGPTVKDKTTKEQALEVLEKYNISKDLNISDDDFLETPKDEKYFENVTNILLVSNQTALSAMEEKAKSLGFDAKIYSDKFQSEAKLAGKKLIDQTPPKNILLCGGETTVKVTNKNGQGGRNQELVLASLEYLDDNTTIVSFDTDGWDNSKLAGAIGDTKTLKKVQELNLSIKEFLDQNNSLPFFEKVGDGLDTGHLPSNVSDLIIIFKN